MTYIIDTINFSRIRSNNWVLCVFGQPVKSFRCPSTWIRLFSRRWRARWIQWQCITTWLSNRLIVCHTKCNVYDQDVLLRLDRFIVRIIKIDALVSMVIILLDHRSRSWFNISSGNCITVASNSQPLEEWYVIPCILGFLI